MKTIRVDKGTLLEIRNRPFEFHRKPGTFGLLMSPRGVAYKIVRAPELDKRKRATVAADKDAISAEKENLAELARLLRAAQQGEPEIAPIGPKGAERRATIGRVSTAIRAVEKRIARLQPQCSAVGSRGVRCVLPALPKHSKHHFVIGGAA